MVSCPDCVRGQPRECIQMRCFICITQAAAAVSLSKCFKLKFTWKAFVSALRGERGEDEDTGRPARVLEAKGEATTPLSPPSPCPILSPPPPPPQDGVAIFWSLLRQRWNRPACLKCTQMQFDLSSQSMRSSIRDSCSIFHSFHSKFSLKRKKKKIKLVLFLYGFVPLWFQVVVCFVALIFLTLPAAFPLVVYEIMMCFCFFFFFSFLKKV